MSLIVLEYRKCKVIDIESLGQEYDQTYHMNFQIL